MVQDKILCFVCSVKGIETTFATYYELQDHLYKDHDMTKDPAMEIFTKHKSLISKGRSYKLTAIMLVHNLFSRIRNCVWLS